MSIGSAIIGNPAAIASQGMFEIVVRAWDGTARQIYYDPNSGWSAWQLLSGALSCDPDLVNFSPNLELLARWSDGTYYENSTSAPWNSWNGWGSLGGSLG